jgi:hypothetical protein
MLFNLSGICRRKLRHLPDRCKILLQDSVGTRMEAKRKPVRTKPYFFSKGLPEQHENEAGPCLILYHSVTRDIVKIKLCMVKLLTKTTMPEGLTEAL